MSTLRVMPTTTTPTTPMACASDSVGDKSYLQYCLSVIRNYLGEYGLELNEKTQIFPLKNGIDFLGFHTYLTDTGKVVCKVRKRSKDNMRRKMKKFAKLYRNGLIPLEKVRHSYGGWRAHASYGNAYHLIQNMDQYYEWLFGEPFRKVNNQARA